MNYKERNLRSKRIWDSYFAGDPICVPLTIYADARTWMAEPSENTRGLTLSEYLMDQDMMLNAQVRAREWMRRTILSDDIFVPEEGWPLIVDFQNYAEAAWFGAEVLFKDEPVVMPLLKDDNKYAFLELLPPTMENSLGQEVLSYYEHFRNARGTFVYEGLSIGSVSLPFNITGTDGPFTVSCQLRGAEGFIVDMIEEPEFACALLDYVIDATIARIKWVREYLGVPLKSPEQSFADDSIVLLSPSMYKKFILPRHKRMFDELGTEEGKRGMHLCGDAQRFFPILQKELGIMGFDTGFPIDFGRLYDELSPGTAVYGGPHIGLMLLGTECEVYNEAVRILRSGVMEKSRCFVLREGNGLAPGTPLKNVNALYRAREDAGYYGKNLISL